MYVIVHARLQLTRQAYVAIIIGSVEEDPLPTPPTD